MQLSLEKHRKETEGQIALTGKQTRIIEQVISNGRITSSEIQEMFKISRQAAHKEITKLINLNILEQKGTGKATYYVVK